MFGFIFLRGARNILFTDAFIDLHGVEEASGDLDTVYALYVCQCLYSFMRLK